MQQLFDGVRFVIGDQNIVEQMRNVKPLPPFSEEAIQFLDALSKKVMRSGKAYSDVVTFGFWCRRAAQLAEKNKYDDVNHRLGKGVVFHIAPSNVPVNFAFSFAAGLLAGNANIVRIPSKEFVQVQIICDAIKELLMKDYVELSSYICMIRYTASKQINDIFSSICDTRVIWGGDETIAAVRKYSLKPRASEITFADRYSITVVDADAYLAAQDKDRIAQDFYNDTFFSDQNACTSPRLVIWTGVEKERAKQEFWDREHQLVTEKYELLEVQAVAKLAALCKVAATRKVQLVTSGDNMIYRVKVEEIDSNLMKDKSNSGFFFEYDAERIEEIATCVNQQCQTLTYYGISKETLMDSLRLLGPSGIDRIVPLGKSMDFSLIWDGHDLIREMSRRIDLR